MREEEYKSFLINNSDIESKVKAVSSRVAKALVVERELNVNLDKVVKNDEDMYKLLLEIQDKLNDGKYHNVHQNAVRKYYLFVNGKEFPRIKQYEKTRIQVRVVRSLTFPLLVDSDHNQIILHMLQRNME